MSITAAAGLSLSLSAFAYWKKALTPGGIVLACLLCILITSVGGIPAFTVLVLTLVGTVAADKAAGVRADPAGVRRKSGSRDARRVFCNVGTGSASIALYLVTGMEGFLLAYYAVMAESLADSLASKIGPLSKEEPHDIWTGERIQAGLSGGVTRLGTFSELCGAVVIAVTVFAFSGDWKKAAIVLLCGFTGAVSDSVLGSRVQVKYICCRCGCITEREVHCGEKTIRHSGLPFMSNDAVNLTSNGIALLLALACTVLY